MIKEKPNIHQLKITLSRVTPPVWRRVQVPEDISLDRLAAVLITVMGWHGGHLHQFIAGDKYYGIPDDEFPTEYEIHDERKTLLNDILIQGVKMFILEYDFGDGWEHMVKVEKALEQESGAVYPRCVDGARQCPPEDCGGPHGYEEFLEAIRDPNHVEHESMLAWIGGEFDPEEFNLDEISDLAETVKNMEELWDEHF